MSQKIKRAVLSMLLVSFVATGMGLGVGSAVANTTNCEDVNVDDYDNVVDNFDDCESNEMSGYTGMLDNVFEVAHTTLQYAGFVTVFAGATLWFTARRSSDRAQTGVWLLIGGLAMIVFYFGFTAFVSLLKWVAEGGSGSS